MIRPTRGKILAQVIPEDKVTASGIHVVYKKEFPWRVKVLATGDHFVNKKGKPQRYRAQAGQVAFIKKGSGQEVTLDGEKFLILQNEDVVGLE